MSSYPGSLETFTVVTVPQHRGVNIGSMLVPEKWMFSEASELWDGTDATDLYTLCLALGPEESTRRMNKHWETWITEADFATMEGIGVNHIRIPIGYWDMEESYPYVFGGMNYIDMLIDWASEYGMTVLLDLHGAPGSQNGQDHSGHAGEVKWSDPENVAKTVDIIEMMAARWANVANVWGFELLNEPHYSLEHGLLTDFYRDCYDRIRRYSPSTHVVINSLYGPHDWTANVFPEPQYRNGVLDLHLYTVWSGFSSPDEYYAAGVSFGNEIRALTPYYPIIVGEMSLATALNPYTDEERQLFADSEMTSFEENAFGFIFWSQKLEYSSADWALVNAMGYVNTYYHPTAERRPYRL